MHVYFSEAQLLHTQFSCLGAAAERGLAVSSVMSGVAPSVRLIAPPDYGLEPLHAIHTSAYLEFLSCYLSDSDNRCTEAPLYLGVSGNYMGPNSWQAIQRSAHSAVAAALWVSSSGTEGSVSCALSYPNGQHAHRDHASMACYVNNQAIAANTLLQRFSRVVILNIGPRHTDGIQQIFYERADVMTISLHGMSLGDRNDCTGRQEERGAGVGYGYNLNFPLTEPLSDIELLKPLDNALGALQDYRAQAMVLSLHHEVSAWGSGFGHELAQRICALALPTVVVIESEERSVEALFETNGFFSEFLPMMI